MQTDIDPVLRVIELRAAALQRNGDRGNESAAKEAERLRTAVSLCRRGCELKAALRSVGLNALEISELGLTIKRVITA